MIEVTSMFKNKVALVTGASTGVGEGIARALFKEGARIVITSRNHQDITECARNIDPSGDFVWGKVADVRNPESIASLIKDITERYGELNYVVCNAGITGPHQVNLADYDLNTWQQVIDTNISGTFYTMKYALPLIQESGGGSIVTLSAVNGLVGIGGIAPYTASKHAIIGLTQSVALEYAQSNIRVNAVAPGYVATPKIQALPEATQKWMEELHPLKRMATMEEVANVVLFLLSPLSSCVTGAVYPVDGGYLAQ